MIKKNTQQTLIACVSLCLQYKRKCSASIHVNEFYEGIKKVINIITFLKYGTYNYYGIIYKGISI